MSAGNVFDASDRFNADRAEQAKNQALGWVDEHTDAIWKDAAWQALTHIASRVPEFTTDRVWYELERMRVGPPREPRALGAVMRNAAKSGMIAKTDRVHTSVRVANHRRPIAVWESLIFREGDRDG